KNSNYLPARVGKALVILKKGKRDEALRQLEDLKQELPNDLRVRSALGEGYLAAGKTDKAVAELEHVTRLAPKNSGYAELRGTALERQKNAAGAEREYRSALENSSQNVSARVGLGRTLAAQGKDDAALDEFQKASALAPQNSEAHRAASALW